MQLLNLLANLPVYLVYDEAPIPFGDPFTGATATSSTAAIVWTVVGYEATAGDRVSFSTTSASGQFLDTALSVGVIYYVVSPSTDTFEVSATKGGSAIAAASTTASQATVHLVSSQVDGTVMPFKPGYTVVALNLSTYSVTLYSAPDSSAPTPGNYTAPNGPGTFTAITPVGAASAAIAAGTAALVNLNNDWIKCSSTAGCILIQN
jgi:hypothetical protein